MTRIDFNHLYSHVELSVSVGLHQLWLHPGLQKIHFLLIPPLGAYNSIRSSYVRSLDAERRANESTTATPSTVSQSADTRRRTERLISTRRDDFNRKNAANKRAIGDLSTRVQGLDMKKVNEKV